MAVWRGMAKLFVNGVILILLLLGGTLYYFRYVNNIQEKLQASYQNQIIQHQIRPITYSQIPNVYREAVIATEDRRFSWDPGIDPVGIIRSLLVDAAQDGYLEGGSTITQQLADNTLLQHGKSLEYKIKQAFYAIGIYSSVSKSQVFEMYANVIYFGHGAYGLYNAAETYFGKPLDQLNEGELTLLAGLPNAPSVYDPFQNLSFAKQRQRKVIANMVDDQMISQQEAHQILQQPIGLKMPSP